MVKIISKWCMRLRKVISCIVDIDASGGTSKECTEAIAYALKKLGCKPGDPENTFVIHSSSSDSSGSGVLDGLVREMKALGICANKIKTVPCGIHILQWQLAAPIGDLIGNGGTKNYKLMQMLHIPWDIQ